MIVSMAGGSDQSVGSVFTLAMAMVWVAAQNDRGGVGGAAPTVRVVEGWSLLNDGFNFWRNPPNGCRDMGVGVGGSGGEGQRGNVYYFCDFALGAC
jgi:hypothetical protein